MDKQEINKDFENAVWFFFLTYDIRQTYDKVVLIIEDLPFLYYSVVHGLMPSDTTQLTMIQ